MTTISHWIGGAVREGTSGRSAPVYDPTTGEQRAVVDLASVEEVDVAVRSALDASGPWRETNLSRRAQVMFHLRDLVEANSKAPTTALVCCLRCERCRGQPPGGCSSLVPVHPSKLTAIPSRM